ncbi:hypothetical protein PR048_025748 [Dryococelus australis]|uniref:Uncharacterized protein n=1 Tax=Dryococelus australis TaxID=614101 RepID=A0ABQ9GJF9_9NEOP|nr:hypothetical protein PR048_025748 [Dryococelus australis]
MQLFNMFADRHLFDVEARKYSMPELGRTRFNVVREVLTLALKPANISARAGNWRVVVRHANPDGISQPPCPEGMVPYKGALFNIFGSVYWPVERVSVTAFSMVLLQSHSCSGSMFEDGMRRVDLVDPELRVWHRHDSRLRKSGERANRSATAAPGKMEITTFGLYEESREMLEERSEPSAAVLHQNERYHCVASVSACWGSSGPHSIATDHLTCLPYLRFLRPSSTPDPTSSRSLPLLALLGPRWRSGQTTRLPPRQTELWVSCQTMPLVGGFSRRSPISPTLAFQLCSYSPRFALHRLSRPRKEFLQKRQGRALRGMSACQELEPSCIVFEVLFVLTKLLNERPLCSELLKEHARFRLCLSITFKTLRTARGADNEPGYRLAASEIIDPPLEVLEGPTMNLATDSPLTASESARGAGNEPGYRLAASEKIDPPLNARGAGNEPGYRLAASEIIDPPLESARGAGNEPGYRLAASEIIDPPLNARGAGNEPGYRLAASEIIDPPLEVLEGPAMNLATDSPLCSRAGNEPGYRLAASEIIDPPLKVLEGPAMNLATDSPLGRMTATDSPLVNNRPASGSARGAGNEPGYRLAASEIIDPPLEVLEGPAMNLATDSPLTRRYARGAGNEPGYRLAASEIIDPPLESARGAGNEPGYRLAASEIIDPPLKVLEGPAMNLATDSPLVHAVRREQIRALRVGATGPLMRAPLSPLCCIIVETSRSVAILRLLTQRENGTGDINNMNRARRDKYCTERMTPLPQSIPELHEASNTLTPTTLGHTCLDPPFVRHVIAEILRFISMSTPLRLVSDTHGTELMTSGAMTDNRAPGFRIVIGCLLPQLQDQREFGRYSDSQWRDRFVTSWMRPDLSSSCHTVKFLRRNSANNFGEIKLDGCDRCHICLRKLYGFSFHQTFENWTGLILLWASFNNLQPFMEYSRGYFALTSGQSWFEEHSGEFQRLPWQPDSPDIKPTKHLWNVVWRPIFTQHPAPTNSRELWVDIQTA